MPNKISSNAISIQLKNVSKSYGKRKVLDNISLNIKAGEFLAIVGHSGCGKSTLLRLLAELETPTSGKVKFDGQNSLKSDLSERRFMFQDARLLPWKKVFDNVMIGLAKDRAINAKERLAEVGLSDRHNEWPARLSGGQKQRISLARALASEPKLLLLDEPLGALDALTRLDMQALIEKLWQTHGFTAILVTHDVSEAVALSDRVLFMSEGKIAQETEIRLARPRQKNNDTAWFEQKILDRILGKSAENMLDFVQI